jgi:hypothetical protein
LGCAEKGTLASEAQRFLGHVLIAYRTSTEDAAARDEAFAMAQRGAVSEAGSALEKAVARFAASNGALAALVREQQDLTGHAKQLSKQLSEAVGQADHSRAAETEALLDKVKSRLTEIRVQLVGDFPDYTALMSPEPLSVAETQALLAPDEVFVHFTDFEPGPNNPLPEAALAFAITKTEVRWVELRMGAGKLRQTVNALRCGLDSSSWAKRLTRARETASFVLLDMRGICANLLGKTASEEELPHSIWNWRINST